MSFGFDGKSLVKIKEHPPYVGDMEGKALLNSMDRATFNPRTGKYSFQGKLVAQVLLDVANSQATSTITATNGLRDDSAVGVGVDQGLSKFHSSEITHTIYVILELISSVPSHNPTFFSRNFTEDVITYIVVHNYHHLRHSQLVGLARNPSSNRSA